MATYTFAQLLSKFNTLLRDGSDTSFTNTEKTELLTEIIENDPACIIVARDTSLTTGSSTTVSWTVPSQFEEVIDFGIDTDGDGVPEWLDRSAWDVINGVIYLTQPYYGLPTSKTVYIYGSKRLTTSDNIPDYLVKYILEVAMAEAYELLASDLGARFLTNDMTMAELRSKINAHYAKAASYRARMANKRIVTL